MLRTLRVRAKSLQSYLTLGSPMDCSLPGSSVHGILQARMLEWVTMPSSRDLPDPRVESLMSPTLNPRIEFLMSPALAGGFFTTSTTWAAPELWWKNLFLEGLYEELMLEVKVTNLEIKGEQECFCIISN